MDERVYVRKKDGAIFLVEASFGYPDNFFLYNDDKGYFYVTIHQLRRNFAFMGMFR